jgi:putative addiction module CopG family antidote
MTLTLTVELEERIRHWIDTGRYQDAEAVVVKALEALEAEEQARFLKARELILAGLNSGPTVELTEELMDEIERDAEVAYLSGEKPSPHVCP